MNNSPFIPRSLQEQCLQVLISYINHLQKLNRDDLQLVHQYLDISVPLLKIIAKKCRYEFSGNKTLIFLPHILNKGELILTNDNVNDVASYVEEHNEEVKIDRLIVSVHVLQNYFKFIPFLSKLSYVTRLELNTWASDDVLAAVGMHMKSLEILDARDDAGVMATDAGLGFLSRCQSLRMVLFSDIADEFDYEDICHFTGKGIAMLMLSLNKLERVETPHHILKDALQFIYYITNSQPPPLSLKCIFLAYLTVPMKTINILPFICPHLETLSVYIPYRKEDIIGTYLKRLRNLKKLELKFEVFGNIRDLSMEDYNTSQIDYLIVDADYIHEQDVFHLNKTFPNLRTLILNFHSFGFESNLERFFQDDVIPEYFQNLQTLQFGSRVSGKLFKLINLIAKNIKALYCTNAEIYELESAIIFIISNGGWTDLVILVLPLQASFTCDFLIESIRKLKNLRFIAACFTCHREREKFLQWLSLANRNLQLCNFDDLTPPSDYFNAI